MVVNIYMNTLSTDGIVQMPHAREKKKPSALNSIITIHKNITTKKIPLYMYGIVTR